MQRPLDQQYQHQSFHAACTPHCTTSASPQRWERAIQYGIVTCIDVSICMGESRSSPHPTPLACIGHRAIALVQLMLRMPSLAPALLRVGLELAPQYLCYRDRGDFCLMSPPVCRLSSAVRHLSGDRTRSITPRFSSCGSSVCSQRTPGRRRLDR